MSRMSKKSLYKLLKTKFVSYLPHSGFTEVLTSQGVLLPPQVHVVNPQW